MNRPNLFTSNSDKIGLSRIKDAVNVVVWVVISLVVIDLLINWIFAYPEDPKNANPTQLQAYFDYGRSVEGKLARMTRADRSKTAPVTLSGWYEPLQVEEIPAAPPKPTVTFYGMSHAIQLGRALSRVSDRFAVRIAAAPAATGNWSYGAYLRDRGGGKSRVVVLALMSANLPMITTMSPMTWNVDFPMPYTAPRFELENDKLREFEPPFISFEQYIQTFTDLQRWSEARKTFSKYDSMFDSIIIRANILDCSSLLRLVRRAYSQLVIRNARRAVLDRAGYRPESEQIKIAREIIHQFAMSARSNGIIPIVYLVNNLGYSDYLFKALKTTLDADKIGYLSSHSLVSPSDPRKYLPNSHFIDAADDELARALVKLIDSYSSQ